MKYRASWEGKEFPDPPPPAQWPRMARWLARTRKPEDKGLGDTLARDLKHFGAEYIASYYEKLTGRKCGCADRQAALNRAFPYPPPEAEE